MIPKEAPIRGSYAEDRLNQLKKDREQYKVNHLGTIRMVFHKKIGLNQTSKLANSPGIEIGFRRPNLYEMIEDAKTGQQ